MNEPNSNDAQFISGIVLNHQLPLFVVHVFYSPGCVSGTVHHVAGNPGLEKKFNSKFLPNYQTIMGRCSVKTY